jgi:hypothetical protein
MQPVPVPRSRILAPSSAPITSSPRSTSSSVSGRGTRVAALSLKAQAPELLLAEDPHHRLALEAARGEGFERLELLGRDLLALAIDQFQPVHLEGRFGEQPRIQFRRVDAGLAEQVAYPPPCCAHVECQEIPSIAASCAAWFSVISAEISSSSASPAITLSSL